MLKKKSKDPRKSHSKKKQIHAVKNKCSLCPMKVGFVINMQDALQRKYSSHNLTFFLRVQQQIETASRKKPETMDPPQQYLEKFCKPLQRKHQFYKIKQIYKIHQETPRLHMAGVVDILSKRHYRKRLLDYFKIAKVLGLKVSGMKTSTFLYSLSKTFKPHNEMKSFESILGKISTYDFTEEIEKELLEHLKFNESSQRQCNPQIHGGLIRN